MAESAIVASNATEISVTELASALRRTLEDRFAYVRVRGEISGYRGPHSSGHVYFCLKDAGARLDVVIWRTTFQRMRVKPEEGLEVVATGKITTFANKSSYQLVVETIAPAGVGALMALLEARRRALAAEGLFDPARKRLLPYLPRVIGVVTSPTGAVIRDILHRLADRFPVHVLVWPVRVQGETSAAEVARAIDGFNALEPGGKIPRPDLLIVARGGGSLEDLWSFNEEIVVRAASESRIPLISAVGHETDWTLVDHAADIRAPTPTAAAELSVPVRSELLARLADFDGRGRGAMLRLGQRRRGDLRALVRALPSGEAMLAGPRQRVDQARSAIRTRARKAFDARSLALALLSRRLARHSPRAQAATLRERYRALERRLARGGAGLTQRFREASAQASNGQAREARRDAQRRVDRLAAAAKRWSATLTAERRRTRERASAAPILEGRLRRAFRDAVLRRRAALTAVAQVLGAVGYRNVLARGFALVRNEKGAPIRRAAEIGLPQTLRIEFFDGEVTATPGATRPFSRPARRKRTDDDQTSLF
jgi:exodeoxyribonuclease VII large subunit